MRFVLVLLLCAACSSAPKVDAQAGGNLDAAASLTTGAAVWEVTGYTLVDHDGDAATPSILMPMWLFSMGSTQHTVNNATSDAAPLPEPSTSSWLLSVAKWVVVLGVVAGLARWAWGQWTAQQGASSS